jgi:DNA polymerase
LKTDILSEIQRYLKQQETFFGDAIILPETQKVEQIAQGVKIDNVKSAKIKTNNLQLEIIKNTVSKTIEYDSENWESCLDIPSMKNEISNCKKCPLCKTRTNFVFGVGNENADIMFIGEAPGNDEDLQGEPFVGRAGQLLNKIIQAVEWKREDVFICNILKCRPPNNRAPLQSEVELCESYLKKQIELINPIMLICLGRIAAQTLLRTKDSLTNMRSKIHNYHTVPLYVTFHPAALLRNPNWKPATWEDFKKMKSDYENNPNKKFKK